MKIPLFPLDVVLFPRGALPLHIFEERYKDMVAGCFDRKAPFGVVRARSEGLAVIGCTAATIVTVLQRYSDGCLDILCEGGERFEIEMLDNSRTYLQAEVDTFHDDGRQASRPEREQCVALHFEVTELAGGDANPVSLQLDLDQPVSLVLAGLLPVDLDFKQELLGCRSDAARTVKLLAFYNAVLPKLRRGAQTSRAAGWNGHVM